MRADAYGSHPLALLYHGLRDRLRGAHARANARWGHLRPPSGRGAVIWVKAGGTARSVRLAAELLGAIRHKRLDVRLVLTFEEDFPQILEPRLAGLQKTGLGYGPADAPRAVRRVLGRLAPLGLICIEKPPGRHLLAEAARTGLRLLAYNTPPVEHGHVEAAYPVDAGQARAWEEAGTAGYVAPPADPLAQLVEAQVEPTFRTLVRGPRADLSLGWLHGADGPALRDLCQAWRQSGLWADTVLFVSTDRRADLADIAREIEAPYLAISAWQREPIASGTLVCVDEQRWWPALAVSAEAIHLVSAPREVFWQALAGGVPVSFGAAALLPQDADGLIVEGDAEAMMARWRAYREDLAEARRLGDACRRRLWLERRRSSQVLDELLQRVYAW